MIWFLNPQVILPFGTTEVNHQLSGGEENEVYLHLIGPSILVLNHLTDANSFSYWSEYENPPPVISVQNEWTFFICEFDYPYEVKDRCKNSAGSLNFPGLKLYKIIKILNRFYSIHNFFNGIDQLKKVKPLAQRFVINVRTDRKVKMYTITDRLNELIFLVTSLINNEQFK